MWLGRELGQPEVQNLRLPAAGHENVRRLDVSVDDPLSVGRVQCVGDLNAEIEQPLGLQRPSCNEVLKGLPLQELHDDKVLSLVLADLMDRANIGMIQGGSCPRFTLKSLQRLMIGRELIGQELQSDVAAQTQVFGLIDHTHATAAQLFQDAVMRNGL